MAKGSQLTPQNFPEGLENDVGLVQPQRESDSEEGEKAPRDAQKDEWCN